MLFFVTPLAIGCSSCSLRSSRLSSFPGVVFVLVRELTFYWSLR